MEAGRKLYSERRFDESVTQFEQANRLCGQPQMTLLPLAKAQLMAQRLEPSLASVDAYLRLQPLDADAWKLRGDIAYLLGRESEAEQSLSKALLLRPDHREAEYALGRIRYQQNRFPEAIERFSRLIQRDPGDYKAHDNLALCHAALQQDSLALQHFLKALDLVHTAHREYDAVYANASNFFFEHGEFQKAFQLGAEAAKRNPRHARNFFLTGRALVRLNKHALSERWFKQAAEIDPTYKQPHYWLATVYRNLGRADDAARSLQRFGELSETPEVKR